MPIHLPPDPPIVEVPVDAVLWRVHAKHRGALWFGPGRGSPPRSRFDAPDGEYGICYFGDSPGVAIIETLVRGRRAPLIPRSELELRNASSFIPTEPLRVLQLEGAGLPAFGLSTHQITGPDYSECQDLALRVWREHPRLAGIQYRSRWENSLCWALFDRAETRLKQLATHWLGDPAVVGPALRPYRHVGVI
ncbi:MAG: RES family NAD+ phosphorylase [Longimicrobiaceae bacterium]